MGPLPELAVVGGFCVVVVLLLGLRGTLGLGAFGFDLELDGARAFLGVDGFLGARRFLGAAFFDPADGVEGAVTNEEGESRSKFSASLTGKECDWVTL